MRIQNRKLPKQWVRPWMFWAVLYPMCLCRNIGFLHRHTVDDVRDELFEWAFDTEARDD